MLAPPFPLLLGVLAPPLPLGVLAPPLPLGVLAPPLPLGVLAPPLPGPFGGLGLGDFGILFTSKNGFL